MSSGVAGVVIRCRILDAGPIDGRNPWVWGMLWFWWGGVCEALKCFFHVAWHGDGTVAVGIVPCQCHSTEFGGVHVNGDGVPLA